MKDDEISEKLTEVEDIIDRLNQGDVTLEEGKELQQKAMDLLDRLEAVLGQDEGEAVVVEMEASEIVKEESLF